MYSGVFLKCYFGKCYLFLVSYCQQYVNVTDPSRFWNAKNRTVSTIENTCQDQQFLEWTRFLYDNTTNAKIPQNCTPSLPDLLIPPCGSIYRGWVQGNHPSAEDGKYSFLSSIFTLFYRKVGWVPFMFVSNELKLAEVRISTLF